MEERDVGPRPISIRQLAGSLLAFLSVFAISGCVVIPTSTEGGFDKKQELIQALIGTSITDVRSQLGEPGNTYELPDATYHLYRRDGDQKWFSLAHPLAMIWYQFPVQWGSTKLIQCLLIESKDDRVVHAEIKSFSDLTGAAMHMTPTHRSCAKVFWDAREIERIEAAVKTHEKKLLKEAAERGNVESAIKLAEDYGEREPLNKLADRGNRQAITAFKGGTCQRIYYRADEASKPDATDNFVYVCEGDDLAAEKTVLISADWDKTYSSPPRRYFEQIPESLK